MLLWGALIIVTNSEKETFEFGKSLKVTAGDVVLLEGELGAGKTALVRGICESLGVAREDVHSPTFAIVNVYRQRKRYPVSHYRKSSNSARTQHEPNARRSPSARKKLFRVSTNTHDACIYHIDAYRLTAKDWEIGGFDEYLNNDSICLIEWANNLDLEGIKIKIEGSGEEPRCISLG